MTHVPEAPPPPPPMHFVPQDCPPHLTADMERLNLDHGVPHYNGHSGSHSPPVDRPFIGPAHHYDPSFSIRDDSKIFATHEGWTFTKQPAYRPNEKETWALVVRTPMPATQSELREKVAKQKKNKGKSAIDLLASSEMFGYKRKQVERLIADRTQSDPDTRFEYKLGSLKLGQENNKRQGRQTVSMHVVLKRQLRSGLAQPTSNFNRRQELNGEVVDLTGGDDAIYSNDSYSTGGSSAQYAPPPMHHNPQMFGEPPGAPFIHDPRMAGHQGPHPGGPQVHAVHPVHDEFVSHHGGQEFSEGSQTPDIGKDKKNHKDKHSKHDKKDKVKVHQRKDKQSKSYSDSSSASFSDDDSFTYTDRTPDTEVSSRSGSGSKYHKDKKYYSGHKDDRRDSRSHDRDRSPTRKVYREHRRKSPTAYLSREGSTKYVYDDYEIITERHQDRDRAYKPTRRPSQYDKADRPSFHPRAQSFDDDRSHRPLYGTQRRLQSYGHPADIHAEKEELQYEIAQIKREKLRKELERESIKRDRLEMKRLEREKLEYEMEREREVERQERERAERDRLDRLDRERFERDRYERERMERDRYDRDRYEPRPYAEPPRRPAYDMRRDDRYYGGM